MKAIGLAVAGVLAGSGLMTALPAGGAKGDEKKGETHDCKGKNSCKSKGGCKTGDNGCAGKNSCKGKGGCAVPVKAEHVKKEKSACSGKSGCKGR